MHHLRLFILLSFATVLATATSLFAQELGSGAPRFEAGLDTALAGPGAFDQARLVVTPRVEVNVSPRTALMLSGDVFATRQYAGESWTEARVVAAELRRGLWQTERVELSGFVGGGVGQSRYFQPPYTYTVRGEPVIVPASRRTSVAPQVTFGVGIEQRVTPRLALRQEMRVVLGELNEFRAQIGVSVPFGRYATRFEPPRTRSGQRPDSLVNGTRIGALVGAATLAGFVAFIASALCEGDCENLEAAVFVGAGYGAGTGALAGALVDSFIER